MKSIFHGSQYAAVDRFAVCSYCPRGLKLMASMRTLDLSLFQSWWWSQRRNWKFAASNSGAANRNCSHAGTYHFEPKTATRGTRSSGCFIIWFQLVFYCCVYCLLNLPWRTATPLFIRWLDFQDLRVFGYRSLNNVTGVWISWKCNSHEFVKVFHDRLVWPHCTNWYVSSNRIVALLSMIYGSLP